MKDQYAKLIDNYPSYLTKVPYVCNCSDERFIKYAVENGYKKVIRTDCPGRFYSETWVETEDTITTKWEADNLETVKHNAFDELQHRLDTVIHQRTRIFCGEPLNTDIVYDDDAITNMLGQLQGAEYFTDADDNEHPVTPELFQAVAMTIAGHRNSLYNKKKEAVEAIKNATSVEQIETILNNY